MSCARCSVLPSYCAIHCSMFTVHFQWCNNTCENLLLIWLVVVLVDKWLFNCRVHFHSQTIFNIFKATTNDAWTCNIVFFAEQKYELGSINWWSMFVAVLYLFWNNSLRHRPTPYNSQIIHYNKLCRKMANDYKLWAYEYLSCMIWHLQQKQIHTLQGKWKWIREGLYKTAQSYGKKEKK